MICFVNWEQVEDARNLITIPMYLIHKESELHTSGVCKRSLGTASSGAQYTPAKKGLSMAQQQHCELSTEPVKCYPLFTRDICRSSQAEPSAADAPPRYRACFPYKPAV